MTAILISLALIFAELSVLAFGGGNSILPEMQRQVVEVHGWMSATEFNALYGLAQAAPGPNMMVVTAIGWHVAGVWGVVVVTLAKFGPSSVITAVALHLWNRFREAPLRAQIRDGLVPVTVGLVAASAVLITQPVATTPVLLAVALVVAALSLWGQLHPLWLLAGGAGAGWLLG